jgi:hypothetical protein
VIEFEFLKERVVPDKILNRIFKQRYQVLETVAIGATILAGVTNVIESNSQILSDRCGVCGSASTRVVKNAQFGHGPTLA